MGTCETFDKMVDFIENVIGNVAAAGARISDEFVGFVQFLRDRQRFVRRKAVFGVCLFLQRGQVVQQRWFLRYIFFFDGLNTQRFFCCNT